jgi:hypothetical protein
MTNIGKPYEGKPHVRFDEEELKLNEIAEGYPFEISFLLY